MLIKEFAAFLKEYKIIGLAVGFVMGTATDTLVKSLVNNLIMPFAEPLFVADSWREGVWIIGPFEFGVGAFFADALRFVILALVIFFVIKKLLKIKKETK